MAGFIATVNTWLRNENVLISLWVFFGTLLFYAYVLTEEAVSTLHVFEMDSLHLGAVFPQRK